MSRSHKSSWHENNMNESIGKDFYKCEQTKAKHFKKANDPAQCYKCRKLGDRDKYVKLPASNNYLCPLCSTDK